MSRSILIVDDDPAVRTSLSETLAGTATDLRAAADAEGALHLLAQQPADLLLTDVRMPGMDGVALLRLVRERAPGTAVVLMSAYVPVPTDNPGTRAKIALGRRLFVERRLSQDGTVSCSSCHRPQHGFSDSVPLSIGAFGRRTRRSAPSLVNVAYARFLFWDGREISLETQVLHPIRDSLEMALPLAELEARLRAHPEYRRTFARVFPDGITSANVGRALASYLRTLRFGDAPLDRYRTGDTTALPDQARRGLALFRGKARCSTCHIGPNLTDEGFHNTGVSWGFGDAGRYPVTGREEDRGRFNTPSLRAVACTAPYMHDGSLPTLEVVLAFYVRGGNPNPNLDEDIGPLDLGPEERQSLLTFLRSLVAGECGSRGQ